MMANDIYPSTWDRPGENQLDWLFAYFDDMVPFFTEAAVAGDVLLMWVS
jgi:hypothetical protein